MNALERRAIGGLALVYWLRMLGLFMVLPVLAAYAADLPGATPLLVGLAVGIYGLTQAMLQIPFGLASDRLGRVRVIVVGLLIFALGSWLASTAESIDMLIAGRALQGAGAIAAAVNALVADLTRVSQRTVAMAILGVSIGGAFLLALILGPVVAGWIGVDGVFQLAAGFGVAGIVVVVLLVPRAERQQPADAPGRLMDALAEPALLPLYGGIFVLHAVMTAVFVAVPVLLRDRAGILPAEQWTVFAPAMLLSLLPLPLLIWLAERRGQQAAVVMGCIALAAVALVGMAQADARNALMWALVAYFAGFNLLEATLPSLVSQTARAEMRGAAMGAYSTAQFLGAFVGGALGGWIMGLSGQGGVLIAAAGLLIGWLSFAWRTRWRGHALAGV